MKVFGNTERCSKFPVFKDKDGTLKEPTWKQAESRSLQLELYRLHRMVQGEDLFAREKNFHQSCRKSLNLKYINHLRDNNCAIDKEQYRRMLHIRRHSHSCLAPFRIE